MQGELKKTLWAVADKQRSSMDAAEYKHIALGLNFLKYISDAFDERRTELWAAFSDESNDLYLDDPADRAASEEERDYYTMANVFWVPEQARWETIRAHAKQADIGTQIDAALEAIKTAQVIEELIEMAKKFREVAGRGEALRLGTDKLAFYDALATNESAIRMLGDETLKQIAVELTQKLRKSVKVDWAVRESVWAQLRVMVRTLLKRYKYPPDQQEAATETVLTQAESLSEQWMTYLQAG